MGKLIFCLMMLPLVSTAAFVEGDGTMDLTCQNTDTSATPFNYFDLVLKYNDSTDLKGFDLISDENLQSGNGTLVYQMTVVQFPFFGAEILPVPQAVPGCELAPMRMNVNSDNGNFDIYFECNGDGDAGYGNLSMNPETGNVGGTISFPEGQSTLIKPLSEDTEMAVTCSFKNL